MFAVCTYAHMLVGARHMHTQHSSSTVNCTLIICTEVFLDLHCGLNAHEMSLYLEKLKEMNVEYYALKKE